MTGIQRWADTDIAGMFLARMAREDTAEVYYYAEADRVEALRQAANEQATEAAVTGYDRGYTAGQQDALAAKHRIRQDGYKQGQQDAAEGRRKELAQTRQQGYREGQRDARDDAAWIAGLLQRRTEEVLARPRVDGACVCQCGKASHAIRNDPQ